MARCFSKPRLMCRPWQQNVSICREIDISDTYISASIKIKRKAERLHSSHINTAFFHSLKTSLVSHHQNHPSHFFCCFSRHVCFSPHADDEVCMCGSAAVLSRMAAMLFDRRLVRSLRGEPMYDLSGRMLPQVKGQLFPLGVCPLLKKKTNKKNKNRWNKERFDSCYLWENSVEGDWQKFNVETFRDNRFKLDIHNHTTVTRTCLSSHREHSESQMFLLKIS